ncbi:unnamed protein product [Clonostachys byssicola]|uniref:JmjC domain-containing protein n=1 Tax=Clonostachys byssicola TaxID=160290 RepID=A0A9N9U6A8_9HYPO|nr:unnamed protein product [Clonostachys byssicola]
MPTSLHPQAKFDPIPPDLDLHELVDHTANLKWVQRVSRNQIRALGQQEFEKLILMHVILGGKPLVIDGWDAVLPKQIFSIDWFEKTYDKKQENVRDLGNGSDMPMTTGHYIRSMRQLTEQWSPTNFRDERRQRLYLKDIDCPIEWRDALEKVINPHLWYLNQNVCSNTKPRAEDDDIFGVESTAAPSGDLMSNLPAEMRAENLMCYIGHEGTYTPAHREMCASLGQNIMVEASESNGTDQEGSSIWFMTEMKDRDVVREYFLSMLGHDIEIEKHFAQINAWKKAPFDVYVVEQKVGDFILVPPLAAHQVWNRGTRTMKVAWNRTTVETLDLALHEALPKTRLVCRDEQYKNKAMIYYTLSQYYKQLQQLEENAELTQMSFKGFGQDIVKNSPRAKQLASDFKKLLELFTEILVDEMFASKEKDVEFIEFDSCVTCSYCRSNIFNRFLTCKHCVRPLLNGDEDAYDVCMECYAMGRSCACLSGLKWCEQWSWAELVHNHEIWSAMVIKNDGFVDIHSSPQPLEVARQRSGRKSVAQICQEALRRRPFKDITKLEEEKPPSDSEPDAAQEAPVKKKYKRKQKKGELRKCHVCCHKDYSYRVHQCTNPQCGEGYCYGVLYRAFDMMPQRVLEDEQWQCPKCQGICNCGACRRSGNTDAYTPKNTSLGHDTRPIADDRSIEALVDFRIHNLSWLKAAGDEGRSNDTKRMQRLRAQANNAKAQDLVEQEEPRQEEAEQAGFPQPDHPVINGYGDQSHILDTPQRAAADLSHQGVEQLHDQSADVEMLDTLPPPEMEDMDASLYPDPSAIAHQRIGMGYYEQDDTPDKILFDPYQAPDAEILEKENREIPEFVKKSIRAAKRRAKRDNEDPDYVAGKNHHKKPRATTWQEPQIDILDNMDPALFQANTSVPEAVMSVEETVNPPEKDAEETMPTTMTMPDDPATLACQKGRPAPRFDANEPKLRHAKPRQSYFEPEEGEVDEIEEEHDEPAASTKKQDPPASEVDLAAAAVHKLFNPKPNLNKDGSTPKRRGRPPRKKLIDEPKQTSPEELEGNDSHVTEPNDDNSQVNENGIEQEPQEQPELPSQRKRRGRPRRSGVTTIMAGNLTDSDEEIGRRTRSRRQEPRNSSPPADTSAIGKEFLSMAERRKLQGKSFKMKGRKSKGTTDLAQGTADETASPAEKSAQEDTPAKSSTGPPEPAKAPSALVSHGPTVVRLGDHDDASVSGSAVSASSNPSSSDDDEDIPATRRVATRGRGRGKRGYRGGRGRGRAY